LQGVFSAIVNPRREKLNDPLTRDYMALICMIVSNPGGGERQHAWQKRVNDFIRAQQDEITRLKAFGETAASLAEKRGMGACDRGAADPSTGTFECRKLDQGQCNCAEFDELAQEIRALT
jgi:hypothetical protein